VNEVHYHWPDLDGKSLQNGILF